MVLLAAIQKKIFETFVYSADKLKIEDPNLQVFDPLESLCDAENCYIIKNGIPLFRDAHHLSVQGSLLLGQALKQKFPALASSQ